MESKEQLLEVIAKSGRDRQEYLNRLFKYMPEAIAKELTYVDVKRNEVILSAGDPCETIYVVLKGQVIGQDHYKMGRIYSFMDFTKMYIVGDFEVFADYTEYCVTIRAAQDCRLLKISANSYLRWIQHDDNALFLRLNNILNTLTFERKLDRDYLLMGCRERLICFLVMLYEKENGNGFGKMKVELTQAELSDKIGFNIRSVQRGIVSLEQEELIASENGKITISPEQYEKLKMLL